RVNDGWEQLMKSNPPARDGTASGCKSAALEGRTGRRTLRMKQRVVSTAFATGLGVGLLWGAAGAANAVTPLRLEPGPAPMSPSDSGSSSSSSSSSSDSGSSASSSILPGDSGSSSSTTDSSSSNGPSADSGGGTAAASTPSTGGEPAIAAPSGPQGSTAPPNS